MQICNSDMYWIQRSAVLSCDMPTGQWNYSVSVRDVTVMFSELCFVSVYMNSWGAQILGTKFPHSLNFVHWPQILVRFVYGACFIVQPSRILNWLLDFWKICAPLMCSMPYRYHLQWLLTDPTELEVTFIYFIHILLIM